jgi:hypothetical protein
MPTALRNLPTFVRQIAVSTGFLALSAVSAASFEDDRPDPESFKAYCVDYYSAAQCDDALRFVRKTCGFRCIAILQANEDPQSYLNLLRMAVEGGQALRLAVAVREKARD